MPAIAFKPWRKQHGSIRFAFHNNEIIASRQLPENLPLAPLSHSLSLSQYRTAPARVASRCDYQLNKGALLVSIYIYKLIPRSKFHASNSATVLYKSLGMLASRF